MLKERLENEGQQSPEEGLVSISQAAQILGISVDTVRRWDKNGTLKSTRPDGKNRYFAVKDLEKVKFAEPLSISEASEQLGVSQATLRRLEEKGIIKPERNTSGERTYDAKSLRAFLSSDYFMRRKEVEQEVLKPLLHGGASEDHGVARHDPAVHVMLGEHHLNIHKLKRFRKIFLASAATVVGSCVAIIVIITMLFVLFPDSSAAMFGYTRQSPTSKKFIYQPKDSVLAMQLRPFTQASLLLLEAFNPELREKIAPTNSIKNVNDIFKPDAQGNVESIYTFTVPDTSYLDIPDTGLIVNLNSEFLQGREPGNDIGDLAILPITTDLIKDGAITIEKLAPSLRNKQSSGNRVVVTGTTTNNSSGGGDIESVIAGIGLNGGGDGGNVTLNVGTGNGLMTTADAVQIHLDDGSGLQTSVSGLSLIRSCDTNEILKWDGTTWACASDGGGGGSGSITVEESDGNPTVNPASTLQFASSSFTVTNSGGGTALISLGNGVLTTSNYSSTLDAAYVNVSESPAAGDITGSFSSGLTIGSNSVALGTDTTGDYVASLTTGSGLTGTASGEGSTPTIGLNIQANKGLEADSNGLSLIDCTLNQILKYNGSNQWICAADNSGGGGGGFTSFSLAADSGTTQNVTDGETASFVGGNGLLSTASSSDTVTFDVGAGNGISVTSNSVAVNVQANKGLEVDTNGVSLIDCTNGQVLKYNASNQWVCANDSTGGGGGGSSVWSDLTDPIANLTLENEEFTSALNWNTGNATSSNFDALTLALTNDGASDPNTQRLLVLKNQDNGIIDNGSVKTEGLIRLEHNDDSTLDKAIEIIGSVSPGGTINTGIDVSDGNIRDAIDVGANNIVGTTGDIEFDNFNFNGNFGILELGGLAYYTGDGDTTYASSGGGIMILDSSDGEIMTDDGDTLIIGAGTPQNLAYNAITNSGGAANGGFVADDNDLYVQGALEIDNNFDLGGNLMLRGTSFDSLADITLNVNSTGTGQLELADSDTVNVGGATDLVYNAVSNSGGAATGGFVTDDNDLYIQGALEVDGQVVFDTSTFNCNDCINYDDISDSLTLDNTTITGLGNFNMVVNLDSSGDWILQDSGSTFLTVSDDGGYAYSLDSTDNPSYQITNNGSGNVITNLAGTGDWIVQDNGTTFLALDDSGTTTFTQQTNARVLVDASTTANTASGGVFDLDVRSTTDNHVGFNLDYTVANGAATGSDLFAQVINLAQNDSDSDLFGLSINAQSTAVTNNGGIECLVCLTNNENQANFITDGLRIASTGGVEGSIATGVNLASSDIGIDIRFQNGETIDNNTDGLVFITAPTTQFGGIALVGDGTGNDYLSFTEESSNPTCGIGDYKVWANSTENLLKKCQNGALSDLDAAGAWNKITAPTDNSLLDHQEFTSEFIYTTPTTAATKDYFTFSTTNASTTDSSTQNVVVIANNDDAAATGSPEALLIVTNDDTNEVLNDGIVITSAAGGITDAIDASASNIVNALNLGDNDIVGGDYTIRSTSNVSEGLTFDTAGGVGFDVAGTAGQDFRVTNTGGSITLSASEAVADAVRVVASNGGIDIDAGTGGVTVDTTGAISLDSTASASNFSLTSSGGILTLSQAGGGTGQVIIQSSGTGSNALRLESSAGAIDIDSATGITTDTSGATADISLSTVGTGAELRFVSGSSASDALRFNTSNAAGGIDIDSGTSGVAVDSTGAISFDSTASTSNFSLTSSGGVLTLAQAGGGAGQVVIQSSGTGANALRLNASDTSGGIDIDSGTGGFIVDTTGAISLDSTASTSNLSLTSSGGILTLSQVGGGTGQIVTQSSGTGANALRLDASAGGIDIDSSTGITADTSGVNADISLTTAGTGAELRFVSGSSTADALRFNTSNAAGGIDIDAGTNGVTVDTTGAISLDSTASTSNFSLNSSGGVLTLSQVGGGSGQVITQSSGTGANALRFDASAGGIDIDSATGITTDTSGASADIVFTTAGTGAELRFVSGSSASDALRFNTSNAAGGIDIDAGTNGVTIDSSGAISLDSTASTSNFSLTSSGAVLTLAQAGGGTGQVILQSSGTGANALRLNASDTAGGIDIDAGTNGMTLNSTGTVHLGSTKAANDAVTIEATGSSGAVRFRADAQDAFSFQDEGGTTLVTIKDLNDGSDNYGVLNLENRTTDSNSLPSSCAAGDIFFNNDTTGSTTQNVGFFGCTATNSWEQLDNGLARNSFSDTRAAFTATVELFNFTVSPSTTQSDVWLSAQVELTMDAQLAGSSRTATLRLQRGGTNACNDGTLIQQSAYANATTATSKTAIIDTVDQPGVSDAITYRMCLVHASTGGTPAAITRGAQSFTLSEITSPGADLAEIYYSANGRIEPGTLVGVDSSIADGVRPSGRAYQHDILGVVSTDPGQLLSDGKKHEGSPVALALTGRVPLKVNGQGGPIKPGDKITSSSVAGEGMRAVKAGPIIGTAITSFDGQGSGEVIVYVHAGSFGGELEGLLPDGVSLKDVSGQDILNTIAEQTVPYENTEAELSSLLADKVVAGIELVAPKVTTKELSTNTIASTDGNGLDVNLGVGESLKIGNDSKTTSTIDSEGNARFDGDVSAGQVVGTDIGERFYTNDASIGVGDVVSYDYSLVKGAQRSTGAYNGTLVGVVSGSPSIVVGEVGNTSGREVIVAVSGVVPVRVNNEGGAIQPGDPITSSSIQGVGMKATKAGPIVGYAIAEFGGESGTVLVRVGGGYSGSASLENQISSLTDRIGKVETEVEGLKTNASSATGATLSDGQDIDLSNLTVGSMTVELDLIVNGAIVVEGPATFKEVARFESDVSFEGNATFNNDTAGYAVLKPGETRVRIVFAEPKEEAPVISLSLGEGKFADYSYDKVTEDGFEIVLSEPATEELRFSWTALSISGANTYQTSP